MRNEEEMMKNEIMAISGVNYKKLDAICERIKQYSIEHGSYFGNLNRIKELLLQGYSVADICYCIDWRNNYMPYVNLELGRIGDVKFINQLPKFDKNEIKDVRYNDPATIVFWKDGTKTVVKCQKDKGDTYNPELGLAMCIIKKMCDNKGNYNDVFNKWLPKESE